MMTRTAALAYGFAALALIAWAITAKDYLPLGLLLLVILVALVHLFGPGKFGKGAAEQHIREQAKARYGINAPDRPRF
ncbi:hypothetical protein [Serinicoccus chungangensis]|uniref:hypothetical protein n=1 Tax=Serinicoccus chungangensis TaxID=767452 RepID=UPI00111B7B38|nr:hypothetical protein [Serinicoccus chungangensis]